ncbi:hypothetical protein OC25_17790 [Pedobacter kyungheensis]|uniref:Uncharacterized protein n=1 Tax=Pedobacter kyungheensis TaxID=1069985 RepID=A0A0C1FWN5_9SPHI|nr:hypothetical protein OC25_17790 [Pedobacter kyungheensis]
MKTNKLTAINCDHFKELIKDYSLQNINRSVCTQMKSFLLTGCMLLSQRILFEGWQGRRDLNG